MGRATRVLALARRPSGFIPLVMSAAALTTVMISIFIEGPARQADEGVAAHIFQILIAGEIPFVAYFALRTIGKNVWATLALMTVQAGAVAAAVFPVSYFNL